MALVGFLLIGATGGWFVIVVPFVLALAVPALILWRTRATMASVIALPAAVRDLDDLDDDLRERLSDVQQASRERGGVRGAVRTVASLVSEVRGSLDDELAPFAAAVETLVPAKLVFAALVLGLGVGAAVVGAVVLFLGLLL